MASAISNPSFLLSRFKSFHSCVEAIKSNSSIWFLHVSFPDCFPRVLVFWQTSCLSSSCPWNSPILCCLLSWASTISLTQSNRSFFLSCKTLLGLKNCVEVFDQIRSCNSVTSPSLVFLGDWTNNSRRQADDTEPFLTPLDEFCCFLVFASSDCPANQC